MLRNEVVDTLVKHFIGFVNVYYCACKTIMIYYAPQVKKG